MCLLDQLLRKSRTIEASLSAAQLEVYSHGAHTNQEIVRFLVCSQEVSVGRCHLREGTDILHRSMGGTSLQLYHR